MAVGFYASVRLSSLCFESTLTPGLPIFFYALLGWLGGLGLPVGPYWN